MEKAPKRHMGLLYVALSSVFLFNPIVALVDILPDAVGYLLLYIGLAKLSDLNERMLDAARRLRIMVFVGVGELLALYLTHVVLRAQISQLNPYEYPATILLFTFLPMLLRFFFLIPAFREFFRGLEVLADRFDTERLVEEGKKGRSVIDEIQRKTTTFIVLQSLFSLLPELAALTCYFDPNGEPSSSAYWYQFITLYRTVALLAMLIVGIVWLISFVRFMRLVLGERAWLERIHSHYCKEILTQTTMLRLRRADTARLLLCIGLPFTVSLRVGGLSVLPSAVFAILVLVILRLLGELLPEQGRCRVTAWWLLAVSLLQQIANRAYLQRFYPEAALYQTDAFYLFLGVRVLSVIEIALTFLLLYALLECLTEVTKMHTEVNYGTAGGEALSRAATERLHAELLKGVRLAVVFFAVAAFLGALDAFLQLKVNWIWIVALLASIAAIWNLTAFLQELTRQIHYRYQEKSRV